MAMWALGWGLVVCELLQQTTRTFSLPERWERTFEVGRHAVAFTCRTHVMLIFCVMLFFGRFFMSFCAARDLSLSEGL